jgi:hypothetical protein
VMLQIRGQNAAAVRGEDEQHYRSGAGRYSYRPGVVVGSRAGQGRWHARSGLPLGRRRAGPIALGLGLSDKRPAKPSGATYRPAWRSACAGRQPARPGATGVGQVTWT